jgi:hypothetical protein
MGANAQTTVPTFTAGQVLTAAQMNQSARTGVPVAADASARDGLFGGTGEKTLAEGQLVYLEDLNVVQYYDGASWIAIQQTRADYIATSQATTSLTYTDLSTVGPTVTIVTGTSAYVTIQTLGADAVSNRQFMSFAVSGASTVTAGTYEIAPVNANVTSPLTLTFVVTGLTAGSNVFTAKYKSLDGNSIAFAKRLLKVTTV